MSGISSRRRRSSRRGRSCAVKPGHPYNTSIELGEAVALSYLRDLALSYNEKFTVTLTKVDGTTATISNQ